MKCKFTTVAAFLAATMALSSAVVAPARADDIITEWGSVKGPTAPALKPVTVDPKTTALLLLDFVPHDPYCGPGKPRCGATLPAVKQLLANARAHGAAVIYSVAGKYEAADIAKDVAPAANDVTVKSKADKFLNTDLEKVLKDKAIQTVIVAGNSANGAVLYTVQARRCVVSKSSFLLMGSRLTSLSRNCSPCGSWRTDQISAIWSQ
jgi:hypothetical protein